MAASGPLYEIAYGRRGRREAARQWAFLRRQSEFEGLVRGAPVLDLGAGCGRLSTVLEAGGWRALALDRSAAGLGAALRRGARWAVRAELSHLPLRSGSVRAAVGLFSSLGHDGHGHLALDLCAVAPVLSPGAPLAIDLPDPSAVAAGLLERSSRWVGGLRLLERRRLTGGDHGRPQTVHKRVRVLRGPFEVARWHEHLPLWTPGEVLAAAREARLSSPRVLSGAALGAFGAGRLLLLGRAPVGA